MKLTVSPQDEKKLNELESLLEEGKLISSDMDTNETPKVIRWERKSNKCVKYIRTYFNKEVNEIYSVERYVDASRGFEIFDGLKEIR